MSGVLIAPSVGLAMITDRPAVPGGHHAPMMFVATVIAVAGHG